MAAGKATTAIIATADGELAGFWHAPNALTARLLTAVLLSSAVLQLALQYRLNYWSRDFFDAFGRRDGSALWTQAVLRPVARKLEHIGGCPVDVRAHDDAARMASMVDPAAD